MARLPGPLRRRLDVDKLKVYFRASRRTSARSPPSATMPASASRALHGGLPERVVADGVLRGPERVPGVRLRHGGAVHGGRRRRVVHRDDGLDLPPQPLHPFGREHAHAGPRPLRLPAVRRRLLRAVRRDVPDDVEDELPEVARVQGQVQGRQDRAAQDAGRQRRHRPHLRVRRRRPAVCRLGRRVAGGGVDLRRGDAARPRLRVAGAAPPLRQDHDLPHDRRRRRRPHRPHPLPLPPRRRPRGAARAARRQLDGDRGGAANVDGGLVGVADNAHAQALGLVDSASTAVASSRRRRSPTPSTPRRRPTPPSGGSSRW